MPQEGPGDFTRLYQRYPRFRAWWDRRQEEIRRQDIPYRSGFGGVAKKFGYHTLAGYGGLGSAIMELASMASSPWRALGEKVTGREYADPFGDLADEVATGVRGIRNMAGEGHWTADVAGILGEMAPIAHSVPVSGAIGRTALAPLAGRAGRLGKTAGKALEYMTQPPSRKARVLGDVLYSQPLDVAYAARPEESALWNLSRLAGQEGLEDLAERSFGARYMGELIADIAGAGTLGAAMPLRKPPGKAVARMDGAEVPAEMGTARFGGAPPEGWGGTSKAPYAAGYRTFPRELPPPRPEIAAEPTLRPGAEPAGLLPLGVRE